MAQIVKTLHAVPETWVRSLGWDSPLEKRMATPVFLPGEFHGQRKSSGLQSVGSPRAGHD